VGAILAVFLGGAAGTALRLLTDDAIPHTDSTFPVSTLLANIVGSFVLGLLVALVWPRVPLWVRAGLGPGLLGGFTTFSAVMLSLVTLTSSGQAGIALVYLLVTLILGFGAAFAGIRLGSRPPAVPAIEEDE
jgi:CrcB protein